MPAIAIKKALYCYHCGDFLKEEPIEAYNKNFCSNECKGIYETLYNADMLDYYTLTESPGCCHKSGNTKKDFSKLDDEAFQQSIILSKSNIETQAVLHLPEIHCSSCWWLIDNLHRLDENITNSTVNFEKKEAHISFDHNKISLRQVVELLANIGYEADISGAAKSKSVKKGTSVTT